MVSLVRRLLASYPYVADRMVVAPVERVSVLSRPVAVPAVGPIDAVAVVDGSELSGVAPGVGLGIARDGVDDLVQLIPRRPPVLGHSSRIAALDDTTLGVVGEARNSGGPIDGHNLAAVVVGDVDRAVGMAEGDWAVRRCRRKRCCFPLRFRLIRWRVDRVDRKFA